MIGLVLLGGGQLEQLQQTVRAEPGNAKARVLLGSALAMEGKRSEALEQMLEAVKLEPSSADVYNKLGVVLSHFSELAAAREAFEKAIALDGNLADPRVHLAMLLAQTGDSSGAGIQLDRVLQIKDPQTDVAFVQYLRGKVDNETGNFEDAVRNFNAALRRKPKFADAWSELGIAQRAMLQDAEALRAFEKAAALAPGDADSQYRLGLQYLKLGKAKDAVIHLTQADALRPGDRTILYALQRALRADGRSQDAASVLAKVAKLTEKSDQTGQDSQTAIELNNAGVELEKKGDLRAALEKYRAAEELNPGHEGFRLNHGLALCRLGHWTEGIAEIREVSDENPENTEASRDLYIALDQFHASEKVK